MKAIRCVILIILLSTYALNAQQIPLYSQYMLNRFLTNPALAGAEGYTIVGLTAREQWLGFENAPQTHTLSFQTRIMRKRFNIIMGDDGNTRYKKGRSGRVGLGGYIYNDRNGLIDRTGGQFTYAYHISMGSAQLSFGLSASAFQFKVDQAGITLRDNSDPILGTIDRILYVPDANAGVYYDAPGFYTGFSVNQLFESFLKFGTANVNTYKEFRMQRHYILVGGLKRPFNDEDYLFEPSLQIKASESMNMQIDANLKFTFNDNYWLGFSYRTNKSVVAMAGLATGRFYIGYAFDYNMSGINFNHSYGSHEIMAFVKLGDPSKRYRWKRRY